MATAIYGLRAAIRAEWRSLLAIAVLVGLAGGAVLSSLGAAGRTSTAFSRMRHATNAWDILVNPNNGSDSKLTVADIRKIPSVQSAAVVDGVILYPSLARSINDAFAFPPFLIADREATYTIGRPVMVAGHQPSPDDATGVWVERSFAASRHLQVGQTFTYTIITQKLLNQAMSQDSLSAAEALIARAPAGLRGELRIEGIGVTSDGVVVDPGYTPASFLLTPAFAAAHPDLQIAYWGAMVKLKPGTNIDAFTARVRALVPQESVAFQRASAVTAEVVDATEPEVIALEAFAGLSALLGLIVVSQAISRRLQIDARHNPTLAALGMTRAQRVAESMAKSMVAVIAGAALAAVIAVVTSGLGPVGTVRVAEVQPGVRVDGILLLAGGLSVIVIGGLLSVFPAWRSARMLAGEPSTRRSRVAGAVAAIGGSLAAVVGVRFGLESGPRRTSVPVRTTLLAAATAVALVTSLAVFSTSLNHLLATPRLYGAAWDGQVELDDLNSSNGPNAGDPAQVAAAQQKFVDVASRSGSVSAWSLLDVGEIRSGAVAVPAIGLSTGHPGVAVTIDGGRAPAAVDEVALGQTTMDRLHTRIGASVLLSRQESGPAERVQVVGRAVLPGLAPYPGSDKAGLGVGAVLTEAGWKQFSSDYQKTEYIFRWSPGKSLATLTAAFQREDPKELPLTVDPVNRPAGVMSADRLRATPTVLGGLLAVLLAAAVANALVVAVRRRRHDLAVLRMLGFTTAEVVRTVLWQATTVGVVGLVAGIPVGIIGGRWTWKLLADRLGTIAEPVVSVSAVAAVAVGVLVLSNAVGLIPGFRAARTPGRGLRPE
jgi:FtsX-like permease family